MITVLVSSYALSPFKGSEFAVGWNFIQNLSKNYKVIVLYGVSDDHMGDTYTINDYLKRNNFPNITFVEIRPGYLAEIINKFNKFGFGWFFYFAFYLWQRKAYQCAKNIAKNQNIDLIHQLVPIGYREPGFLWKIQKPFVWGPIGGTTNRRWSLVKKLSLKDRTFFLVKNLVNWVQFRFSFRLKIVFKRANSLIASTLDDADNIARVYKRKSAHITENGLNAVSLNMDKFKSITEKVMVVWSGSHDARKNLIMLLKALIPLKNSKQIVIHILGEGPQTKFLKQFAEDQGLSQILIWHGNLPRKEAVDVISNSHLHVITSIGEANTTVLFEAMSYCVPTISLNHCGMKDVICDKCGIKIYNLNYTDAINEITIKLQHLINNPDDIISLSKAIKDCSTEYLWETRLNNLNKIYQEAIKDFKNKLNA